MKSEDDIRLDEYKKLEQGVRESVRRNFEMYSKFLKQRVERQSRDKYFVQGMHDQARLMLLQKMQMGVTLNKLQHRIGRQRTANNKQRRRIQELQMSLDRSFAQRELERASYELEIAKLGKEIRELRRDRDKPAF